LEFAVIRRSLAPWWSASSPVATILVEAGRRACRPLAHGEAGEDRPRRALPTYNHQCQAMWPAACGVVSLSGMNDSVTEAPETGSAPHYRPGGGPGGPRISNPFRAAIEARRAMSGCPSIGGGTTRAGAGTPTSRRNPSNCIGWKPTRALAP